MAARKTTAAADESTTADTEAPENFSGDERTVVERILAVARDVGILAPERSGGVPFAFRGIDAVVSKLTPYLNRHGVFVVPTGVEQGLGQRDLNGGKTVTKADLKINYRFYGAKGDFIEAQVPGQADDFADRSTAQAMSVAFRILLLQVFHIAANGNEEAAAQDTMNAREAAGVAKVSNARAKAEAPAAKQATANEAAAIESLRGAIVAAAERKGMELEELNTYGTEVTGKSADVWFNDPDELDLILQKISGE